MLDRTVEKDGQVDHQLSRALTLGKLPTEKNNLTKVPKPKKNHVLILST